MDITPKQHNGKGYFVVFRHKYHPKKKIIKGWLKTREEHAAFSITRDLKALFADPGNYAISPEDPRVAIYDARARELFYGKPVSAPRIAGDTAQNVQELYDVLSKAGFFHGVSRSLDAEHALDQIVHLFKKLKTDHDALRLKLDQLTSESEFHKEEASIIRRKHNLHVKIKLRAAVQLWAHEYPENRSEITAKHAIKAVKKFLTWVLGQNDGPELLGSVRASHIGAWLASLKRDDGEKYGPTSKKNHKAYLSTFFTWCMERYDLAENPMDKTGAVAGVQRHAESIVAIRREKDLLEFIEALKPSPYWQAFAAVACLAGPRYSELINLRLQDVYLEEGYIHIATRKGWKTKTGHERKIPIERTKLMDILTAHVKRRIEEQESKTTVAAQSAWLFPSQAIETKHAPQRTKTPPGQWGSRTFLDHWILASKKYGGDKRPGYWAYGPDEWRHTFGTALGMVGKSSLEIKTVMGNSEEVARKHYIAATGTFKRWAFEW